MVELDTCVPLTRTEASIIRVTFGCCVATVAPVTYIANVLIKTSSEVIAAKVTPSIERRMLVPVVEQVEPLPRQ